jgi:hypothetical protein
MFFLRKVVIQCFDSFSFSSRILKCLKTCGNPVFCSQVDDVQFDSPSLIPSWSLHVPLLYYVLEASDLSKIQGKRIVSVDIHAT